MSDRPWMSDEAQTEGFVFVILREELLTIAIQAEFVLEGLETALAEKRETRVWLAVHSTLVLAGNASKLLWGTGRKNVPKAEVARTRLKDEAGVKETSPLRERNVRDAFEHIDERIIVWAHKENGSRFVQRRVDWKDRKSELPFDGEPFGNFDPETWLVTFRYDDAIPLRVLFEEFKAIRGRLRSAFG
jgi:hypothetical protein